MLRQRNERKWQREKRKNHNGVIQKQRMNSEELSDTLPRYPAKTKSDLIFRMSDGRVSVLCSEIGTIRMM